MRTPVLSPGPLVELYARAPTVHPYGLADLEEPFWTASRWWRDGDAAVGVLSLPEAPTPVVYAIAATDPDATLALLLALSDELPDHFVITGPVGLARTLGNAYETAWSKPHMKMHLGRPEALPAPVAGVVPLGRRELAELEPLYAADPDAGDFFFPNLLDTGLYFGRRAGSELVAAAGVHVVSKVHDVAAVGNVATHPAHRRRGHAGAVLAHLCRRLLSEVSTVGLNVGVENTGALALYRRLGFDPVLRYDEVELRRITPGGAPRSGTGLLP